MRQPQHADCRRDERDAARGDNRSGGCRRQHVHRQTQTCGRRRKTQLRRRRQPRGHVAFVRAQARSDDMGDDRRRREQEREQH